MQFVEYAFVACHNCYLNVKHGKVSAFKVVDSKINFLNIKLRFQCNISYFKTKYYL